jgi:hypothetical protein
MGFALVFVGLAALLTAAAMSDRFRSRWSALFSDCLGLVIPAALRTLTGNGRV